jgi:hypothetical protein
MYLLGKAVQGNDRLLVVAGRRIGIYLLQQIYGGRNELLPRSVDCEVPANLPGILPLRPDQKAPSNTIKGLNYYVPITNYYIISERLFWSESLCRLAGILPTVCRKNRSRGSERPDTLLLLQVFTRSEGFFLYRLLP